MSCEHSGITHSIVEVISPSIGPIPDRDCSTSEDEVLCPDHREIDPRSDRLNGDDELTTPEGGDIGLTISDIIEGCTDRPDNSIDEECIALSCLVRTRITDDLVESVFSEWQSCDLKGTRTTRRGSEGRVGSCEVSHIPSR